MKEADLYTALGDGAVKCRLCPHGCTIREGDAGICGVRINRDGTLYAGTYAKVSSEAVDPVEKKPLFHFLPGTTSYSLGGVGCNFRCLHCQNWQISQADLESPFLRDLPPELGVRRALMGGCASIAWTYNEPTIWHEYTMAMGQLAKKEGLGTIYVTNGYITEEALDRLSSMLDAFRVDIKAFSDEFYRKVCKGRLQPVLDATVRAKELGMHIETVTLVIPGQNDDMDEMKRLIDWVFENLGPETPMHFTRFHPDYRMQDSYPTPVETLEKIHEMARERGIRYVYIGNLPGHPAECTYCPACGALLIERSGYLTRIRNLDGHQCASCGEKIEYVSEVR
ncbi:MAG: AmmeMemoRadiSam system radical SAM enzyme [Methanoculleaceae archaeon]